MRVFVTGASGFIGSVVVPELLRAGHQVLGLARSDRSAEAIAAAGAEVHRGTLDDLDSLRSGASASDGVIHCAFIHDFSNYLASAETDRKAIEAMGDVLVGSDRPLVVTSGMAMIAPGRLATEEDVAPDSFPRASEAAASAVAARGVRASVVRLPPSVHGDTDFHGFVPTLINRAREKGASAYVGEGLNRWCAVHVQDAARLYRLVLEKGATGTKYHAIGDEGIPTREIAEVIGRHLNVPVVSKSLEEAPEHFGWIGNFFSIDCPASSAKTQELLGWKPTGIGVIPDLEQGHYFERK